MNTDTDIIYNKQEYTPRSLFFEEKEDSPEALLLMSLILHIQSFNFTEVQ